VVTAVIEPFIHQRHYRCRMSKASTYINTDMKSGFADVVYVVSATKNDQSEFWACATPRRMAAARVQRLLPIG
jgi:hypothetical protein